jgi:hypothetical protein
LRTTQGVDEIRAVQAEANVDFVTSGAKTLKASFGDFFGYEHARHPSIVADSTPHHQLHRSCTKQESAPHRYRDGAATRTLFFTKH